MPRTVMLPFLASCLFALGCEQRDDDRARLENPPTVYDDRNLVRPAPVIVEGCLTAAGDRFVLTQLEGGVRGPRVQEEQGARLQPANEPTTQTYRLVGMHDVLRPLVGRRVEVTGEAEPEKVVDVRQSSPAAEPQPSVGTERHSQAGAAAAPDGTVTTVQTARIEINDLRVRSARATSDKCVAAP